MTKPGRFSWASGSATCPNRGEGTKYGQKRVILVTGVAGYWGSRVAARLVAEESDHVLGLDARSPARTIETLDFVLADVRNPLLVELLKVEGVDTVCHLAFRSTTRRYGYLRDRIEIEKFCNGFCRRTPGMALTTLRFSSIVGPAADTPMTGFLRLPWAPGLMGFDPMMQVIHDLFRLGSSTMITVRTTRK